MENDVKDIATNRFLSLEQGKNRLRIVGGSEDRFGCYLAWHRSEEGNKPFRTMDYADAYDYDTDNKPKKIWVVLAWNYATEQIEIWEIPQKSIIEALRSLVASADWGDLTNYDIEVSKTGQKLDTRYTVMPQPVKSLTAEIKTEVKDHGIDIKALLTGGDPFAPAVSVGEMDAAIGGL